MNVLRTALSYFSIFPVGFADAPRASALAVLPFVGIVVGAVAGSVGWLASLVLPAPFAIVLAFGSSIVLTGAIHLDGFLDACDALFASVPPERRFEILADPRHGTYALAGLAVAVPAWLAAIGALPPANWPWALAFSAGSARGAAVVNAFRLPYGRAGASARAFEERPNAAVLGLGVLASAACCWPHPWLALLVIPAVGGALALGGWCAARLGGALTGDCYGALVVVLEVVTLATMAAVLRWPK